MAQDPLVELCHRLIREDPAAAMLVRMYPTGLLQLVDAGKKLEPGVDSDALRDTLYRFLVPGMWAADEYAKAVKANPNVTGKELAEILRASVFEECEHGRSTSGTCMACEFMEGQDVDGGALELAREDIKALRDFAKSIARDYDHDEDAHRYNTLCRVCEAEKVLKETD